MKPEKHSHQPCVLWEDVGKPWKQPQKGVGLSKAQLLQTDSRVRTAGPSCWENRKSHTRDEDAQIGKGNKGFQGNSSDGDSGKAAGAEGRIRANPRLKKHLEPMAWEMRVDTGISGSGSCWY